MVPVLCRLVKELCTVDDRRLWAHHRTTIRHPNTWSETAFLSPVIITTAYHTPPRGSSVPPTRPLAFYRLAAVWQEMRHDITHLIVNRCAAQPLPAVRSAPWISPLPPGEYTGSSQASPELHMCRTGPSWSQTFFTDTFLLLWVFTGREKSALFLRAASTYMGGWQHYAG